ncbi:ATP-binding protein, partial [Saccharothrix sp. NRRL B-16314]|uniref:ATP-binding protein n=1 Tax=Saccharothrix sp. NRRL B-16314 TaxID=1463825 RepID=UPI003FA7D5FC
MVAEALSNVTKHSNAANAVVEVARQGSRLLLRISDDGQGGADESKGSGLAGIRRRIEAYDGR